MKSLLGKNVGRKVGLLFGEKEIFHFRKGKRLASTMMKVLGRKYKIMEKEELVEKYNRLFENKKLGLKLKMTNKGASMFAAKSYQPNDVILKEFPLITFKTKQTAKFGNSCTTCFKQISQNKQQDNQQDREQKSEKCESCENCGSKWCSDYCKKRDVSHQLVCQKGTNSLILENLNQVIREREEEIEKTGQFYSAPFAIANIWAHLFEAYQRKLDLSSLLATLNALYEGDVRITDQEVQLFQLEWETCLKTFFFSPPSPFSSLLSPSPLSSSPFSALQSIQYDDVNARLIVEKGRKEKRIFHLEDFGELEESQVEDLKGGSEYVFLVSNQTGNL